MNSIVANTVTASNSHWFGFFGMFAAVITGVLVGCLLDRRRYIFCIRSQVAMVREDIERAADSSHRDRSCPNSLDKVWAQALPRLREVIFTAIPHMVIPYDSERLKELWVELRDLDISLYFEAASGDEIWARNCEGINTVTQKQSIINTLERLERYIR